MNGEISSEGYPDITDAGGFDVRGVANCKYVCDEINTKKGTGFQPPAGIATQAANLKYLLTIIDNANNNLTSYRNGVYATNQVVDITAVIKTLNRITTFEPKAWTVQGSYQVGLPPGTYRMTAVSGKGGNGGFVQFSYSANLGGSGALGTKINQTFTISSPTMVTVVIGSAGSRGGNGSSNKGHGSGGGGGGGASGIIGYYYAGGGGGGGGATVSGNGINGSKNGGAGGAGSSNGSSSGGIGGTGGGGNGGKGEAKYSGDGGAGGIGGYGGGGNGGAGGYGGAGGGGGGGGQLTGTIVDGLTTNEYPYVTLTSN